jgi:hypothetical protein
MTKGNVKIFVFACSAATLAISTVHVGYPPSWRMYVGMPGLYIALIAGWLGLGQITGSVYVLTFLINAFVYYGLIRLVVAMLKVKIG